MYHSLFNILAGLLTLSSNYRPFATAATCSSDLLIDDFSWSSPNFNNLGGYTSDDGSMDSLSVANNVLSLTPGSSSYFYETFPCVDAAEGNYDTLLVDVKGPDDGVIAFELQTKDSCDSTGYNSAWYGIGGITGSTQTISVSLSSFSGANSAAISAIAFTLISSTSETWEISNIRLGCNGGSSPTITAASQSTLSATATSSSVPTGDCSNLVVDDWISQSRLTFLFYNALLDASSDDGTMQSVEVDALNNRMTLTPVDTSSYFYSKTQCLNAENVYGGISLRINAPQGSSFGIELSSSSDCGGSASAAYRTTEQLGWTFDGTEKLYDIKLSEFSGLDTNNVDTIFFSSLTGPFTFGPMAFYCGNTVSEYEVSPTMNTAGTSTVAAPAGTASPLVIDSFQSSSQNALSFWHGGDDGMSLTYGNGLTIVSSDADYSYYTLLSDGCADFSQYADSYLHIAYTGSTAFTVALQQHNEQCDRSVAPFPETWDSLEAARYASGGSIYMPMSHFHVNLGQLVAIAIKGFYVADSVTFTKIEIVKSVPNDFQIPNKLPSGNLIFSCSRPNSFAFAIDDGIPDFAEEVMQIIKEEDIKVTFFTVGAPLLDQNTNLSNVYNEMMSQGHQIALHSFTHPKMEGLPNYDAIDWEYEEDIKAVDQTLNGLTSKYFRPPFGNEGARMRQRLVETTGASDAYIVNWSVDIEDYLWADTNTPEKQLEAFQRDVDKGGNLVVLHYLFPSTVGYLRQFIQIAKGTGKDLMRVDQCMEDPEAPPLA